MDSQALTDAWRDYQDAQLRLQEAKDRCLGFFIPRILGLAHRYLRDKCKKDDLTGSVLLSFIENHGDTFEKFHEPGELWELFAEITVRHCQKHNKRDQRFQVKHGAVVPIRGEGAESGLHGFEPVDSTRPPDEKAVERECRQVCTDLVENCERILAEEFPKLSNRLIGVLGMHLAGARRAAMAESMNVSIPTIDNDLEKIRSILDRLLVQAKEE